MTQQYTKEFWKGSVLTAPLPPTLVTCEYEGRKNVFTVAWTGVLCTQPPVTYISVRPERFSYDLIKKSGEFVINLPTEKIVRAVDFCGVRSGRNLDKFSQMNLHTSRGKNVNVPILDECPVNIECKVRQIIPLGTHHCFVADIVGVDCAKELIDSKGRLALEKAGLLAYSHGEYFSLGKKLGSFGYSVRKKKVSKKSHKNNKGKK